MNEREYNRMKAEIEAEYRRKLDALELVWGMSGGRKTVKNANADGTVAKGQLLHAVRQAVSVMPSEFNMYDVIRRMKQDNPALAVKRASVASTLKRLVDSGFITVDLPGKGKRPSRYRVKAGSAAT